jgi:hypothetical protein
VPAEPRATETMKNHRSHKPAALAWTIAGVLALTQLPAFADGHHAASTSSDEVRLAVPPPVPPDGMAWLQGSLTDQAGHRLDNVNVEIWPKDSAATEPIASNLTYAGVPEDGRHDHGVYRVEVPVGAAYRIIFSAVGGAEDADAFRMKRYGGGRPLMARSHLRTSAQRLVAGKVRDLGTTQLVHQGRVASKMKVNAPKASAGKRARLKVRVTSPFVRNVTGRLVVRVAGHRVRDHLTARDHGTTSVRLPKLRKADKYKVSARYLGSRTVKKSATAHTKVTVRKKQKRQ